MARLTSGKEPLPALSGPMKGNRGLLGVIQVDEAVGMEVVKNRWIWEIFQG